MTCPLIRDPVDFQQAGVIVKQILIAVLSLTVWGAGNTLIGVMPGDSRETTMTVNDPQTVANERS
jgi:hypothetical protein